MNTQFFVVKYSGPFGYIKPWSAVRDEITFSQLYLSGSTIKGMSQKLFGLGIIDRIKRHRLCYDQLVETKERTLPKLIKTEKNKPPGGILERVIMLNPVLYLAFESIDDANVASVQHLCLCRNEDLVWPSSPVQMTLSEFEALEGFEYLPQEEASEGVFHGWDRWVIDMNGHHTKQYGKVIRKGEPMRVGEIFGSTKNVDNN